MSLFNRDSPPALSDVITIIVWLAGFGLAALAALLGWAIGGLVVWSIS